MSLVKELWYGNIAPSEYRTTNEEYKLLSKKLENAEKELFDSLPEEKCDKYDECAMLLLKRECVREEEIFSYGFRLGVRLILDVFSSEELV